MFTRLELGRIAGIDIYLDMMFVLILLIFTYPYFTSGNTQAMSAGFIIVIGLILSILLHELGHAFAGRLFDALGRRVMKTTGAFDYRFVHAGAWLIEDSRRLIGGTGTWYWKGSYLHGPGIDNVVMMRHRDWVDEDVVISFKAGPLDIQNHGTIAGPIVSGSGNDTVTNQGTGVITGDIDLGGGANSLLNRDDAVINSSDRIALGAGNTFTNSGILNPGGLGTIQQTTIIGNFAQTAGGRLIVDLDEAGRKSDFLAITGTASLGGSVIPNFLKAPAEMQSEYRIVFAAGGVTSTGIAADPTRQVGDTVGYDFGLAFRGGTDVYLTAEKRAALDDLAGAAADASGASGAQGGNMTSLGTALDSAEKQGGSGLGALITALRLSPSLETMAQTMNRLIPQNQGAQTSNTSSSGSSFGKRCSPGWKPPLTLTDPVGDSASSPPLKKPSLSQARIVKLTQPPTPKSSAVFHTGLSVPSRVGVTRRTVAPVCSRATTST